ncbi:Amiloride-sensitive sodium channel [Branchiostoma belcheri]|nr:Amiloride-sensitive sodium channel [Branchiostoma belcheri]
MAACCSCQDGALDHEYASNTSLHGPGNIINAKRPAHRAVWVVLFLAAFGVAVWQISERRLRKKTYWEKSLNVNTLTWRTLDRVTVVRDNDEEEDRFVAYFSYNTVTSVKVEFKDELAFPAVTICNFNKFQLSKVTPSELNYITEVLDLSTGFEGDDTGELGFDYDDYEEEGFGPEEDDYSKHGDQFGTLLARVARVVPTPALGVLAKCASPGMSNSEDSRTNLEKKRGSSVTVWVYRRYQLARPTAGSRPFSVEVRVSGYEALVLGRSWVRTPARDQNLNVSAIPSNFDLADLTMNAGFVLDETTLQDCRWRGKRCYAENFTHAFTSYGNCWTFNSNDDKILRQTIPGSGNGLYLVIDVQQEQYTEKPPSGNSDAGLKFLVHPLAEPPKIDSQGTAVQPGTHAYASIQNILYKNEIPPWGTCDPTWRLDNYDTYTKTGCLLECRAEWVKKDCGCRTVSMPGNATYCSPTQLTQCVKTVVGKLADGRYPCECPTPCVANTFPTTVSYAAWPSTSAQDYYTNLFNHTAEYLQRNFVVMDLYYAQLNYQEVIQTRQYTVGSFLGDFGGQLGLFLGASVITIAEFIEYIVMKVTQPCSSRGKRRTDTEMTSLGIDTKSSQSSPLS